MSFKKKVVHEIKSGQKITDIAKRYRLSPKTVRYWVKSASQRGSEWENAPDGAKRIQKKKEPSKGEDFYRKESERKDKMLAHVKEILARNEAENAILRDLLKKRNPHRIDRIKIAEKWIKLNWPVRWVLGIVGVATATYYDHRKRTGNPVANGAPPASSTKRRGRAPTDFSLNVRGEKVPNKVICDKIMEFIERNPNANYGHFKVTLYLKHEQGIIINKKKVYRLMREVLNILPRRGEKHSKNPINRSFAKEITRPHELYEADIKYLSYMENGEPKSARMVTFLDVFTRVPVGWHIGAYCISKDVVATCTKALMDYKELGADPQTLTVRTDNGSEFTSHLTENFFRECGIHHERIPPRSPDHQAHIESFHSRLEMDVCRRNVFNSFEELYIAVNEYMVFFREERYHGGICYKVPIHYMMESLLFPDPKIVVKVA